MQKDWQHRQQYPLIIYWYVTVMSKAEQIYRIILYFTWTKASTLRVESCFLYVYLFLK